MEKPQVMIPQAERKLDFYGPAHKGHRTALFKIASDAGRADYTDQKNVENIKTQLAIVDKNIRGHATWEEKSLHPLLVRKVPLAAEKIEEEHKKIHHELDVMAKFLDELIALPSTFEKRGQVGQEFYLAFNRFLMMYLDHIGYEEEQILPLMWNLSTMQEIVTTLAGFQPPPSPEELRQGMEMMTAAINIEDLTQIMMAVKTSAPPQVAQLWLTTAEKYFTPEAMAKLKARIEPKSS